MPTQTTCGPEKESWGYTTLSVAYDVSPIAYCRRLEVHMRTVACRLACESAGSSNETSRAMMLIATKSSISVMANAGSARKARRHNGRRTQ